MKSRSSKQFGGLRFSRLARPEAIFQSVEENTEHSASFPVWKKAVLEFGNKLNKALYPASFLLILSCTPSSPPEDILGIGVERVFQWIDTLRLPIYLLPVRLAAIFGLVTISVTVMYLEFEYRLEHWQIGIAFFFAIVGLLLPIQAIVPSGVWPKGWLFVISTILTFVLPYAFPFYLVEAEGHKKWTFRGCLMFIGIVFVLTLFHLWAN